MHSHTPASDPLDALVREHAAGVFRYLRSLVGDPEEARDLLQETFLRLGRYVARHGEDGRIGTGLVFATARSCAVDHLRRQRVRRHHEVSLEAHASGRRLRIPAAHRPDRTLEGSRFRHDLAAALAALPEEQRTVFHLTEIEGLTYQTIARFLGISPGTVASRKHLAVRKLRDHLRRLGYET